VTTAPLLEDGYQYEWSLGYIMTVAGDGRLPLWDCYQGYSGNHYNTTDSTNGCGYDLPARLLGYVYATQQPGTHAIYQCTWMTSPGRGDSMTGTDCGGFPSTLLGYVLD